jgi:hypothetical protein
MIDFSNLKEYATDFPTRWSFLGSPEDAAAIPPAHKDQIHFLSEEASRCVGRFLYASRMLDGLNPYGYDGCTWIPFRKNYFRQVDDCMITLNGDQKIKKWLYNRGIPFGKEVILDADISGRAVVLTWKMVIKYWEGLFFADDLVIFDETLNWGLFYFHESHLYFGKNRIFNMEEEYVKMAELNELRKQYPFLKFPY